MTPLHFAHALLSTPELVAKLVDFHSASVIQGRSDRDRMKLLLDEVERVHDRAWGRWPRHQVKGARVLFEERVGEVNGGTSLVAAALGLIAQDLFVFHKGEVRWERAAHLRWREEWSGRSSPEAAHVFARVVGCLKEEPEPFRVREMRELHWDVLQKARRIPLVADPEMEPLYREGLAEVHRHESLSKLPSYVWHALLAGEGEGGDFPEREGGRESWRNEIRRARRLWRGIHRHVFGRGRIDLAHLRPVDALSMSSEPEALVEFRKTEDGAELCARYMLCVDRELLGRAFRILVEQPGDGLFESAVHQLLLLRAEAEASLLHPPQGYRGLDRFKEEFVDHKWQGGISASPEALWQQAWVEGGVRWLEIKLGPGKSIRAKTERWVQAAFGRGDWMGEGSGTAGMGQGEGCAPCAADGRRAGKANRLGSPDGEAERPALRFVLHFLRRADAKEKETGIGTGGRWADQPRWAETRRQVEGQARELREVLHDPELGELWVGVDAASFELAAPAEVFAPAFRMLRAPWALSIQERRADGKERLTLRNLGASVHAGEEFTHLVSGMRWVDEHIRFLELQRGDRIGHGLAVGLDPGRWREQCGRRVTQTNLERLDDLVWLWDRLSHNPEHAHRCHRIAQEAAELSAEVYEEPQELYVLREAWLLRTLDPLLGMPAGDGRGVGSGPEMGNLLVDECRRWQNTRLRHASKAAKELWKRYTWDRKVRKNGAKRRMVELDAGWDLPLRKLQDQILEEICTRGIAIEANPSSNLAIATLGSLRHHPIFRWFPVNPKAREGRPLPRVCVGSDDPAIFHTELGHEYALLAQAAREAGESERDIRLWIDELRRSALDLWFDEVRPVVAGRLGAMG